MPTEAPEAPEAPAVETPAAPEIVVEIPKEIPPEKPAPLWAVKTGVKPLVEEKPPVEVVKTEPVKGGKEESLSNLRKKLEEREKELEDVRGKYSAIEKEYGDYKAKPFELPEEHKTRLTKAEQERDEYLNKLKALDVQHDPQYQEKFVKPIQSRISVMQKVAMELGLDEAALKQGFGRWDKQAFGEWIESMDAGQKARFSTAWGEAELLEEQRIATLNDPGKAYEEMAKAREAEAKSQFESNLSENQKMAKGLIQKFILDNESTKDFEDLPGAAENVAMRVARYEVTPQEVMEAMINNQALARMHGKQAEVIKARDEKIAELEKKLADQDAFIKEHAGSTPNPNASGVIPKNGAKPQAMWDVQIAAR